MPTFPANRNLGTEIAGITGQIGQLSGNYLTQQQTLNPALGALNTQSYTTALRGNFDPQAFDASNPGFLDQFNTLQGQGQLSGWTPEQFALAFTNNNQGALDNFYRGGAADISRTAFDRANPGLVGATNQLSQTVGQLNALGPARYDPTGYAAVQAQGGTLGPAALGSYNAATTSTAAQQRAGGGPLLGSLERDAARGLGQVSGLQSQQEGMAARLLAAGGGLTAGETADVQQAARAAYADRGLVRSNRGIGAEILATDQAQRQRLTQNLGLASGIDAAGQAQRAQSRSYALGVQGQGQNLSTFNAGQGNALGQFNADALNRGSQFNSQLGANVSLANAGMQNEQARFGANLAQQNNQFNASATNAGQQFSAGTINDANRFNATADVANREAIYSRTLGNVQAQQAQAIDPLRLGQLFTGQAPDYTGAMLNYGSDLNNTNYNSAVDRYYNTRNNRTAGLGAIGQILGGPFGNAVGTAIGTFG